MANKELVYLSDVRRAILRFEPEAAYILNGVRKVDAVEVVRCKDCKKGHPELAPNGGVWCAKWNHIFCDDGFCSYGERRSNA